MSSTSIKGHYVGLVPPNYNSPITSYTIEIMSPTEFEDSGYGGGSFEVSPSSILGPYEIYLFGTNEGINFTLLQVVTNLSSVFSQQTSITIPITLSQIYQSYRMVFTKSCIQTVTLSGDSSYGLVFFFKNILININTTSYTNLPGGNEPIYLAMDYKPGNDARYLEYTGSQSSCLNASCSTTIVAPEPFDASTLLTPAPTTPAPTTPAPTTPAPTTPAPTTPAPTTPAPTTPAPTTPAPTTPAPTTPAPTTPAPTTPAPTTPAPTTPAPTTPAPTTPAPTIKNSYLLLIAVSIVLIVLIIGIWLYLSRRKKN